MGAVTLQPFGNGKRLRELIEVPVAPLAQTRRLQRFLKLRPFLQNEEPPMIRLVGALLLSFAFAASAYAAGGCGVGCHSTSEGACVRDGWQQAMPVRNVCPATSRASPPCGPYHRWSRRSMMCIPT
jgi:hypothetical protein